MKVIGLIGGMSWESTAHYYALLNKAANERLGGHHSAKILLYSIDFDELAQQQFAGKWEEASALVVDAASRLEKAGADFVLICANTMHIAADEVQRRVSIPLIHIADATAEQVLQRKLRRVALLGTSFTMEGAFYKDRLGDKFGLEVLIPQSDGGKIVHDIIYNELVRGIVNPDSKAALRRIIAQLVAEGAEAVILGCTELMMIIEQQDSSVPVFDTTAIHCQAAMDRALA